jgi:hypothetical protein
VSERGGGDHAARELDTRRHFNNLEALWTRVAKFETESYPRATQQYCWPWLRLRRSSLSSTFQHSSASSLRSCRNPVYSSPPHSHRSTASSNPPTQATFSETSQSEVDSPDSSLTSDSAPRPLIFLGSSSSIIAILAKGRIRHR